MENERVREAVLSRGRRPSREMGFFFPVPLTAEQMAVTPS